MVPTPAPISPLAPDAFSILVASDKEGSGALYLYSEEGELRLPLPAEVESAWQPAISLDGKDILFTGRRSGQSDIALMSLDGNEFQWLTSNPTDDYSPAWSPDGRQLAWVAERAGRGHLWVMDVGREGQVEPRRLIRPHGDQSARYPAWAPDGSIYFSALDDNGMEEIYHYDFATDTLTQRTFWPLKGTQPAVSPSGEVVFVGWGGEGARGFYRLTAQGEPQLLWEGTNAIEEPSFSADSAWILFTRWTDEGGSHDIWALPAAGGEPQRVTSDPAWETDAVALPDGAGTVPPLVQAAPISLPEPYAQIIGFNVANVANSYLSRDLGFGWAKGFAFWERIEKQRGELDWLEVDNTVQWFEEAGLQILLRVDRTPTWARPPDTTGSHPPIDLDAFATYLEALATRYRGRVAAYELWNEPNLSLEWGEQAPDPAYYVELLRVARPALQRGDPNAKLIVGALAVTENSNRSMNEFEWMHEFYSTLGDISPRPYDAFSTHPYGFGQSPDFPPDEGPCLRRLEQHRALMESYGDSSPLWLTELGYARQTPGWDLGEHAIGAVSDEIQARYILETLDWLKRYQYVEAVFIFNLDFSIADWYVASEQMRAYAILDSARRPLPLFTALRKRWLRE